MGKEKYLVDAIRQLILLLQMLPLQNFSVFSRAFQLWVLTRLVSNLVISICPVGPNGAEKCSGEAVQEDVPDEWSKFPFSYHIFM